MISTRSTVNTIDRKLITPSRTLSLAHSQLLRRSGIDCQTAKALGVRTSQSGRSYVIPLTNHHGDQSGSLVRFDGNDYRDRAGRVRKFLTMGHQGSTVPRVYYPDTKSLNWAKVINNIYKPIYITEGPKKAISLSKEGYSCIGLLGTNHGIHKSDLCHELKQVKWKDRHVYIVFDNDKLNNRQIQQSESELAETLKKHGAKVHIVELPQDSDLKGADDFLAGSSTNRQAFNASLEKSRQA